MNAKQRRQKRRVIAPAIEALARGLEAASETGEPMYPGEMKTLADGLRSMVKGEANWIKVVRSDVAQ